MIDWSGFWHMDGHGGYVWSAYLIAVIVLVVNFVLPLRRRRSIENELRRTSRAPGIPRDSA